MSREIFCFECGQFSVIDSNVGTWGLRPCPKCQSTDTIVTRIISLKKKKFLTN